MIFVILSNGIRRGKSPSTQEAAYVMSEFTGTSEMPVTTDTAQNFTNTR